MWEMGLIPSSLFAHESFRLLNALECKKENKKKRNAVMRCLVQKQIQYHRYYAMIALVKHAFERSFMPVRRRADDYDRCNPLRLAK